MSQNGLVKSPITTIVHVENEKAPVPVEQLTYLAERERYAYLYFLQNRGKTGASSFPLAYSSQESLYNLYLNGRTCVEIREANPQFGLGQIVFACVDGDWERRRQEHFEGLMAKVGDRVKQVTMEGASFAADVMSATHALYKQKINQFYQTGDMEILKDLGLGSVKTYKDAVELLQTLTGQDKVKTVKGQIDHHYTNAQEITEAPPTPKDILKSYAIERAAKDAAKRR